MANQLLYINQNVCDSGNEAEAKEMTSFVQLSWKLAF